MIYFSGSGPGWYFLCDIDLTAVSLNSLQGLDTLLTRTQLHSSPTACKQFVVYCHQFRVSSRPWPGHTDALSPSDPRSGSRGSDNGLHVTSDTGDIRGWGASTVNIPGSADTGSCLNTSQPTQVFLYHFLPPPPTNAVSRPYPAPAGWLMLILTHFCPRFCLALWGQKTICLFLINSNMRHGSGSINLASNVNRNPGNSAKNNSGTMNKSVGYNINKTELSHTETN